MPQATPFDKTRRYPDVAAGWVRQYDFRFIEGSPGFDKRAALQLYPEPSVLEPLAKEDRERFEAAMAKVRQSHPHPYYWAPFSLIGKG